MASSNLRHKLSRRTVLTGVAALAGSPLPSFAVPSRSAARPVVVASANGHQFRNGGTETCVERAFRLLTAGSDVLDALIEGVNIVELDPLDDSVGYGGLPNADGVVQLDSCLMHGPRKWAGGVAALEGVRTPSKVARDVMRHTDHHLLVGEGAQRFARNFGHSIEADLNTENSRKLWLEWKRRTDPLHYLNPEERARKGLETALTMTEEGLIDPLHVWGTIHCNGVNPEGHIAGVTTTSGLAFKIPGRIGDSPILGAGCYVDGEVGAAGSTGRGEANLYNLSSYLIVEELRRGAHPKDAGLTALRRVAANTERRLQNAKGEPTFNLQFYITDARGRYAGVAMRSGPNFAVCDEKGARLERCEPLF